MKSVLSSTVLVCSFLLALPAIASEVTYTPIRHSDYQAVYDDGSAAWPGEDASGNGLLEYSITLFGVVINNPADMLDYSVSASSPKWQVFIQATEEAVAFGDFGGTALYMMRDNFGDGSQYYTNAKWGEELERIGGFTLQYGDLVRVDARAPGMNFKGKYNVNEKHNKSPDYDFEITVIGSSTPKAASITLADLKDTNNDFIFREDRQAGCEHYQASLVSLNGLLLDGADDWALDGTVTVKQTVEGIERTFSMKLGLDNDLASIDAELLETTPFSVTAILDQEDNYCAPYTGGYRLWLTSASNLDVVPEPGSLALLVAGGLAAMLLWRRRRS